MFEPFQAFDGQYPIGGGDDGTTTTFTDLLLKDVHLLDLDIEPPPLEAEMEDDSDESITSIASQLPTPQLFSSELSGLDFCDAQFSPTTPDLFSVELPVSQNEFLAANCADAELGHPQLSAVEDMSVNNLVSMESVSVSSPGFEFPQQFQTAQLVDDDTPWSLAQPWQVPTSTAATCYDEYNNNNLDLSNPLPPIPIPTQPNPMDMTMVTNTVEPEIETEPEPEPEATYIPMYPSLSSTFISNPCSPVLVGSPYVPWRVNCSQTLLEDGTVIATSYTARRRFGIARVGEGVSIVIEDLERLGWKREWLDLDRFPDDETLNRMARGELCLSEREVVDLTDSAEVRVGGGGVGVTTRDPAIMSENDGGGALEGGGNRKLPAIKPKVVIVVQEDDADSEDVVEIDSAIEVGRSRVLAARRQAPRGRGQRARGRKRA